MANTWRGRRRFLLKLKRLKPAVRHEIELATGQNAKDVARLARAWAPVDDGDLRDSTKALPYSDGPAIRWRVVSGDDVAFYARMVEFGTAPGVKGATATNAKGRKRTVGRTHPGNAPQPYFFPAYRALRKRLKRRLTGAFRRARRKV